jgi:hypothetical protein
MMYKVRVNFNVIPSARGCMVVHLKTAKGGAQPFFAIIMCDTPFIGLCVVKVVLQFNCKRGVEVASSLHSKFFALNPF